MEDLVIVELWYQASSPDSAAFCYYYKVPKKFCKPLTLRLMASYFDSLFVVCESVYGCRQFKPLFKIIPWSIDQMLYD